MPKNLEYMREVVQRWLCGVRESELKIKQLESRIISLRDRMSAMQGIDYSAVSVSGSKTSDKLADGLSTLDELIIDWEAQVSLVALDIANAVDIVQHSSLAGYAVGLHDLYGLPWEEVAAQVNYSRRTIYILAESGYVELYDYVPREVEAAMFAKAI